MKILSIDGGGYLGLATAKFIEETERHFGTTFHKEFDLFCGTSTGAIISLALASGMNGSDVVKLYEEMGRSVFFNPFPGCRQLRYVRQLFIAKYSNRNLKRSLENAFGNKTLLDIAKLDKKALITSFSVTKGTPRVFKTDHSTDLTLDSSLRLADIALASSAAQTYLPTVKLNMPSGVVEVFSDGGVFANHPALVGYAEAISHLRADPNHIKLLSLSTPRKDISERPSALWPHERIKSRGVALWALKLASIFVDGNSAITHESLRRIINWDSSSNSKYMRVELRTAKGLDLDITTKKAATTLKQIGQEKASDGETRGHLQAFFKN